MRLIAAVTQLGTRFRKNESLFAAVEGDRHVVVEVLEEGEDVVEGCAVVKKSSLSLTDMKVNLMLAVFFTAPVFILFRAVKFSLVEAFLLD